MTIPPPPPGLIFKRLRGFNRTLVHVAGYVLFDIVGRFTPPPPPADQANQIDVVCTLSTLRTINVSLFLTPRFKGHKKNK